MGEPIIALILLALNLAAAFIKSKRRLAAENAALRQLSVLPHKVQGRIQLTSGDCHSLLSPIVGLRRSSKR